jgi:hypothetical protein
MAVTFGGAAVFTDATLWWTRTEATRQAGSAWRSRVDA